MIGADLTAPITNVADLTRIGGQMFCTNDWVNNFNSQVIGALFNCHCWAYVLYGWLGKQFYKFGDWYMTLVGKSFVLVVR